MDYTLRIARRRPQGGMDTSRAIYDAPSVKAAIAHAIELTGHTLNGSPGVAILTSETHGIVWTYRQNLPAPPSMVDEPR